MSDTQPTVLPWHREAAKECYKHRHGVVPEPNTLGAQVVDDWSAIIARHDPHAAELIHAKQEWAIWERNVAACEKEIATLRSQHAETLRLLKAALFHLEYSDLEDAEPVKKQIRAHLGAYAEKGSK
jgi:hypothetical protein